MNTYRHVGNRNEADRCSSVLRRDKLLRPGESVRRATSHPMCYSPAFRRVLHFERSNASFPLERTHSGLNATLHSSEDLSCALLETGESTGRRIAQGERFKSVAVVESQLHVSSRDFHIAKALTYLRILLSAPFSLPYSHIVRNKRDLRPK